MFLLDFFLNHLPLLECFGDFEQQTNKAPLSSSKNDGRTITDEGGSGGRAEDYYTLFIYVVAAAVDDDVLEFTI